MQQSDQVSSSLPVDQSSGDSIQHSGACRDVQQQNHQQPQQWHLHPKQQPHQQHHQAAIEPNDADNNCNIDRLKAYESDSNHLEISHESREMTPTLLRDSLTSSIVYYSKPEVDWPLTCNTFLDQYSTSKRRSRPTLQCTVCAQVDWICGMNRYTN